MLGTMLSREVEDGIFETTREWLANDPEAYLFLSIDELHLVRGSAGTELSFLIKSLLQRLGLDKPDLIHKLRILASSASLPLDGENEAHSLQYLRDLFAPYGTSQGSGDPGTQEQTLSGGFKKNELKPHLKTQWVIPPEANGAFVAAKEDVLSVYTRPHDPDRPLVCLDGTTKQLQGNADAGADAETPTGATRLRIRAQR